MREWAAMCVRVFWAAVCALISGSSQCVTMTSLRAAQKAKTGSRTAGSTFWSPVECSR